MKYLLVCPACNSRIAVETGQAGQTIRCSCGNSLEVPSIRGLRALEQVADDRPAAASWTKRKGLLFLGGAMLALALVAAAAVLALRPSVHDNGEFKIQYSEEAIRSEVAALSPIQAIERFQMVDGMLPTTFAEQKREQVPEHLQPSLDLLISFEGPGAVALARQEAAAVMRQIVERNEGRQNRAKRREAMNDWLVFIGVFALAGLLTAGSALFVGGPTSRGRRPVRPAAARTRSE